MARSDAGRRIAPQGTLIGLVGVRVESMHGSRCGHGEAEDKPKIREHIRESGDEGGAEADGESNVGGEVDAQDAAGFECAIS